MTHVVQRAPSDLAECAKERHVLSHRLEARGFILSTFQAHSRWLIAID